jgi:hypothetical protein
MIKCTDCGKPYGPLFLWLSDADWKELGYKPKDFVCAHCIIDKVSEHSFYAFLTPNIDHEAKLKNENN